MSKDIHASKRLSKPQKAQRNSIIDETIMSNIELQATAVMNLINPKLAKKGLPEACYSNVFRRRADLLAVHSLSKTMTTTDSIKEQLKVGTKPVVNLSYLSELIDLMKANGLTEVVKQTSDGPVTYRMEV